MRVIRIEIRSVYGEDKAYPVCADAHTFAQMLGTKTLTRYALRHILGLGYTIEVMDRYGGVSKRFEPTTPAMAAGVLPAVR